MENLLKEKLHSGEQVIGTMFQLGCPTAVECLGIAGLDFFIIDTEHAPVHVESTRLFVMASELRKITPLVRVKRITRDIVLNALDIGAGGLIAPGVETPEQVRLLVDYAKYPPEGSRGFCLTRTSAFGQEEISRDPKAYFRASNDSTLIIPQCETLGCLAHIDEIAAIPGVDGIFIGPYDLSVALGKPAEFDDPAFQNAVTRVLAVCRKAGKFALIFSGSAEQGIAHLTGGFEGIVLDSDVDMFISAYQTALARLRRDMRRTPALAVTVNDVQRDIFGSYLSLHAGVPDRQSNAPPGETADLAIIGGTLILPEFGRIQTNVYVNNGFVSGLSTGILPARTSVDAAGRYVLPGIIDPHTHFGIGASFQKDLHAETLSAIVGGITTVGSFIAADSASLSGFAVVNSAINQQSYTDVVPHFVIGSRAQIPEIADMVERLGIRTFKVYLNGIEGLIPSVDDAFVVDVMEALKATGKQCLLFVHCENSALVERATKQAREKYGDEATLPQFGESHPAIAEEEAVMRIAFFAKKMQQHIYIVHVSTQEGAEMVHQMKRDNPFVHAETTSPYLTVTADEYDTTIGLMAPPLRSRKDQDRLWQGVLNGDIDTIGTDNVALTLAEKGDASNVWKGFPGYPALGTHLIATLNEGVRNRGIAIERLVPAMTKRPAELMGIYPKKGTLMPGSDADIVIVDMDRCTSIQPENLYSRSDFSLYQGKRLCAGPVMTVKGGRIVAQNGKPVEALPLGHTLLSK